MAGVNTAGKGTAPLLFSPIASAGRGFSNLPVTSTPMPSAGRGFSGWQKTSTDMPSLEATYGDDVLRHNVLFKDDDAHSLATVVQRIGHSIGESIASCLESRGLGAASDAAGQNANLDNIEHSNLRVFLKADVKPPVYFRGDGSERCTVHEWEEMMRDYLQKSNVSEAKQGDEVICRLMGHARDIVKVGLRSSPTVDLSRGPGPVFDMLKQHFSDTSFSSMPLADFYATLPMPGELPFDYWLRLNRAMEIAEDCLRQRHKSIDDPSREVAAMFIRHCPDPELSLIFKSKPLSQWSAADVRERLDEYWREYRFRRQTIGSTDANALRQEVRVIKSVSEHVSEPASPSASVSAPLPQRSADPMDRVLALLERVLEQRPHQLDGGLNRGAKQMRPSRGRPALPCEICGDGEHTTQFHCRSNIIRRLYATVLVTDVDQKRMGSPFESLFLSRFLPHALREFFLATVALGLLTGGLDSGHL